VTTSDAVAPLDLTSPPRLAVGGIAVVDQRILLVQRGREPGRGLWSVPGGKVERGERAEAAVVREVLEETGLTVEVERFLGWVERIGPTHHFVILDFVVHPVDPRAALHAGDDADDAAWVPLAEIDERPLAGGLASFLRRTGILPPAPVRDASFSPGAPS
jgi:8-oxo-dGTP diphosphatase